MSSLKPSLAVLVLSASLIMGGCGNTNPQTVFSPQDGHPAGWTTGHQAAGKADVESCFACHGDNLDGGISKVSCTSCHLGSSGSIHPLQWGSYAYARHKGYIETQKSAADPTGTSKCATAACHGATLDGVAGSGPSCANTCHLGGALVKHPAVWSQYSSHGNYVKGKNYDFSSCSTRACHGTDARGVFLSGHSCFDCHPADPAVVAPVPDKHPHNLLINGSFLTTHKQYINTPGIGVASCWTNLCHGANGVGVVGSGPSCSTSGCHN